MLSPLPPEFQTAKQNGVVSEFFHGWLERFRFFILDRVSSPGDVRLSLVNTPRSGWLLCDGSSVSKAAYADLFAVIGGTFGQTGQNFSLPNPSGDVLKITVYMFVKY